MNLPVASCLICGQERELAVWVDPAVAGGSHHGVCFSCREAAQQRLARDAASALAFAELHSPRCNALIDVEIRQTPRP